jgi:hypothetical protein
VGQRWRVRNEGDSPPTDVLQMVSHPYHAQVGIRGCWRQPYLGSTVHAKAKEGSVWSGQNIPDKNPLNRQWVGLQVHVCTHLLAWYHHKKRPQGMNGIPRGDIASSSLVADPQLPDSAWQMVRCHYWDQDLYPQAFPDWVNPQEWPATLMRERRWLAPKRRWQTACHKLRECVGSDTMVNTHDRECRNFGVDQVFRLMAAELTIATAFHGFVYSKWISFRREG